MLPIFFAVVAASGARVAFTSGALDDDQVAASPSNAGAGIIVDSDGSIRAYSDSAGLGNWITPQDAAGTITTHVKLSAGSGTFPDEGGLAADTWYEISIDRSFHFVQSGVGTKSYSGTMSLSVDAGATTIDTVSVTLAAEVV